MQWTAGQQAAIDARNESVLVSAAAGSGKTAVLVERMLSLLREGGRIDRMLIVTFTRAAAGEMRERIGKRLEEEGAQNAHLRRQAMRLNRACICTLHVFCARVLREHFEAAEIDPLCRIGDEDKLAMLKKRAQDEVLEAAYQSPDEDLQALFSQFEDEQIVEMMEQLYEFLMAQEDPWGWAEECCREEKAQLEAWMPILHALCAEKLEGARELMPEMEKILSRGDGPTRYAPAFEADAALMHALVEGAQKGTLNGGKTSFCRLSTKKAGPGENPDLAEAYKALRNEWKERINDARALLPENAEAARDTLAHPLPALRALCQLTRAMEERYFAYKQNKNYLDYSDLEHLTLKALADDRVKQAVAGKFDALFIDEYQDVSGIQEAILRALHEGQKNLSFMVGDVKQSIYRFRLADPTLFLQKYRDFSLLEDAPQRKILLQQNFRSDENVLRSVNQVFSHAMRERETEIAYDEAAMLRPGGNQPLGAAVEIHLMTAQEEDGGEGELTGGYRYEAAFVARRIRELMHTFTVRDQEGTRPLRFRDIAILLRYASGRAPQIARILQQEGIPVYSDADAQFFDLPEVKDLLNLLQVIDNPLQDVALLSALRCPCFGFDEEELARIRLVDRTPGTPFHQAFLALMEKEGPLAEKAKKTWEQFATWRFLSMNVPVDQLIWQVMEESGLYMRSGALEEGELRQANLRLLAERAQGESAREGLSQFLRETGRIRSSDDGKSAKTLGENEDVVRILTMHKSKGLEFPVVFLMELARPFRNRHDTPLRLHAKHGMALEYVDGERRVTRESPAVQAMDGVLSKEARAEEARLLYVGMTRAREKLILLGSPRQLSAARERWARPASAYAAGAATSMLDWVMESLGGLTEGQVIGENGSVWQMQLVAAGDLTAPRQRMLIQPPEVSDDPASPVITARLSREILPQPPLKTSVSAIAKPLREEKDDWESPGDKRLPPPEGIRPLFLADQEITAAQRGTITHRVLGLVDYDMVKEGKLSQAVRQLEERGLLSEGEKQSVRMNWLRDFFASDLGKRALSAGEIHREWAFNLRGEGQSLIQGVIDLCFLEGEEWVLVDYKTDWADEETLKKRYTLQIQWYARALAIITGKRVKEAYIFSLRENTGWPVPLEN